MAKICFLWWFDKAPLVYKNWNDGLRAAIDKIGEKHDVEIILGEHKPEDIYDFILIWTDSNCPFLYELYKYKCRKGICLTTDPHNIAALSNLDVIFCESDPVLEQVRRNGLRGIKAFGTNDEFFKPTGEEKNLEYFYPATFSPWKRQSEIANLGNKLLCVGTIQPDGMMEYQACLDNKVQLEVGYYPAQRIKDHYNRAKNAIIPAIHGSERTVLEAMSMDILPEVIHKENTKTYSYIEEYNESTFKSPREFISKNYSADIYAKQLLKGIEA